MTGSKLRGPEHVRVLRHEAGIQAGLLEIPMGQYFGGASVPCLGVAGVAVAPEQRGQGHARRLMTEMLHEARQRHVALSALYPATLALYRGVGYELAGCRYRYVARVRDLPCERSELVAETLRADENADYRALYQGVAKDNPGYLDRSDYIWQRIVSPRGASVRGVSVSGAHGPEGYLYLGQKAKQDRHDLFLSDWAATTQRAWRALLAYVARHQSTAEDVSWCGAASEPRLYAFPEKVFSASLTDYFMLRLVHVEQALAARGYPALERVLDLKVDDAVLAENSGRYRVEIEAGQARVTRSAGRGRVRLGVRALASLYAGFASARQLARAGYIEADAGALGDLDLVFAGAMPGMPDYF